jgi:hypothetical protein
MSRKRTKNMPKYGTLSARKAQREAAIERLRKEPTKDHLRVLADELGISHYRLYDWAWKAGVTVLNRGGTPRIPTQGIWRLAAAIVRDRFRGDRSLDDLGREFQMTRERVRQIESTMKAAGVFEAIEACERAAVRKALQP